MFFTALSVFVIALGVKIYTKLTRETMVNRFMGFLFTPMVVLSTIPLAISGLLLGSQFLLCIVMGLALSVVADVYMNLKQPDSFMSGMIYFSFAHLLYISGLSFISSFHWMQLVVGIVLLGSLTFIYIKMFFNKLDEIMKISIPLYMILVTLTLLIALGVLIVTPTPASIMLFIGTVLFWLSDLVIAISTFYKPFKYAGALTWALYGPAQLLIALSIF